MLRGKPICDSLLSLIVEMKSYNTDECCCVIFFFSIMSKYELQQLWNNTISPPLFFLIPASSITFSLQPPFPLIFTVISNSISDRWVPMFFDFSVSYSPTHIMNLEHNQNPVLSLFNRSGMYIYPWFYHLLFFFRLQDFVLASVEMDRKISCMYWLYFVCTRNTKYIGGNHRSLSHGWIKHCVILSKN